MATPYVDVLARNARAGRARIDLDQESLAARMRQLGFTAWRRQTVANVERTKRRLAAEEVLGLSIALETTVQALLLPANEDDGIILPSGRPLDGHSVQASVLGYTAAALWASDGQLLQFPSRHLPQPDTWPPVSTLRGKAAAGTDQQMGSQR